MKKIYSLNRSRFMLLLLLLYALECEAQKKAPPGMYTQAASQVTFIVHAPVVLPALLERQQYDTLGYYLQNWKNSYYPSPEFIFAMQVLLAIQSEKYNSFLLPFDCLNYLSVYAKQQAAMLTKGDVFRYYIKLDSRYSYDATEDARKTMLFIRSWSKELIRTRKLTRSQLFICRTLSGDVTEPLEEYKSDPDICPDLEQVQKQLQDCKKRYFADERSKTSGWTFAFLGGGWFPANNLYKVIGWHPSIGFSIGWRNRLNEYDLTGSYRFYRKTLQPYAYLRDTLYFDNYYEGGFWGVDYTRYLVHTMRSDLGLTAGAGYEYFNLPTDDSKQYPESIHSFNWNVGVRYKYFVRKQLHLGFVAKYNVLHYANTGGTNLDGNAFTLDLTFGSR